MLNKHTRRPCRYPFYMVEEARKMRRVGFEYREISEFIGEHWRAELDKLGVARPAWITVRDWVQGWYRMRG